MTFKNEPNTEIKFIDLFSGIGGFRIAFENLGMKCVFSSEIDEKARQVYELNFGEIPYGDITKINPNDIPNFDILAAGFPCQPFSYAGKLEGFEDKTRGTLFFDIVNILKHKKPKMFLLENVKGLKSHDKGKTLETIERTLENLGYKIYWKIINSHDFGVPQARERWYCVGFDQNIYFEFPNPDNRKTTLRDIVDLECSEDNLRITEFEMNRINHHFNEMKKGIVRVEHDNSKYGPDTKKGKYGIFSFSKPDGTIRFHVGDTAKTQIQEAYYCCLDSVAPTIIATREPKLWDIKRRLSVKECSRLQGFPESFKFNVGDSIAKKQLGNSVTVPVIEQIAYNMIKYYYHERTILQFRQLSLDIK